MSRAVCDRGGTAGDGDLGGGVDGQRGESAVGWRGGVVHARERRGDSSKSGDGDKRVLHFDGGWLMK